MTTTAYQEDQLERLRANLRDYPRGPHSAGLCVDFAVRKYQTVPKVWQELEALGLVKITHWDDGVYVRPVEDEAVE